MTTCHATKCIYAKYFAVCIVVVLIVYHGFQRYYYRKDSCTRLLEHGRFNGQTWQPSGCMMQNHSQSDTRKCFASRNGTSTIVFMGDSRIRNLYYEFSESFTSKYSKRREKVFHDLSFDVKEINLKVDFLWRQYPNKSMLNEYRKWSEMAESARPKLVVTGVGLHSIYFIALEAGNSTALQYYRNNLTQMVPYINALRKTTKVIWRIQDPVEYYFFHGEYLKITNAWIDLYNEAAYHALRKSAAMMWSTSRQVFVQSSPNRTKDGIHILHKPLYVDNQILVNLYCNKVGAKAGACCRDAEPVSTTQVITAVFFGICCLLVSSMWMYRRICHLFIKTRQKETITVKETLDMLTKSNDDNCCYVVLLALAKLGLMLMYFFICDGTTLFMNESKDFSLVTFLLLLGTVLALGLFFTKDSKDTTLLHRDQTDEWKGWMQLVILIYHITGASKILPIYMHIRVLVAAYLFMSGYGHFLFFWNKGLFELKRVCQVLFRLNLLTVCLCLVMNRPYQHYYFVPLISFWFLLICVTMAIWPRTTATKADKNTRQYFYVTAKLVILSMAVTFLFQFEAIPEKILLPPIRSLFVLRNKSVREWVFRLQLDRYSAIYGMVFALSCFLLKKFKVLADSKETMMFSRIISCFVTISSTFGLFSYVLLVSFCRSKQECNHFHSYITFLPILSFVLLRNMFYTIRKKYSAFFAWFGKISLELFIAQYHVWLAADTKRVLVLIPDQPVLNFATTTFIFVCLSHEIHAVTETLAKHLIPNNWKLPVICERK